MMGVMNLARFAKDLWIVYSSRLARTKDDFVGRFILFIFRMLKGLPGMSFEFQLGRKPQKFNNATKQEMRYSSFDALHLACSLELFCLILAWCS
jgi:hypothetical protein